MTRREESKGASGGKKGPDDKRQSVIPWLENRLASEDDKNHSLWLSGASSPVT